MVTLLPKEAQNILKIHSVIYFKSNLTLNQIALGNGKSSFVVLSCQLTDFKTLLLPSHYSLCLIGCTKKREKQYSVKASVFLMYWWAE